MNSLLNLNEKIFIAGANGMVGRAIKKAFISKNYGNKTYGGNLFTPSRKELDLTDQVALEKWFAKNKPTVVVIAAARVGGILANSNQPYEFIYENLKIETNLIEISKSFNVKRLLFLGSSCIYPKNSPQPIKEEYLLSSSLEPTNEYYAIAKIAGIKMCEAARNQYNLDAISLMPTNLYGYGDNYSLQSSHVIPALVRKFYEGKKQNSSSVNCWGTGKPLREFLHADDLGKACVFALENWNPDADNSPKDKNGKSLLLLNVGSDQEISIENLAKLIGQIVDFKGKINWDTSKPDGTKRKLLDSSRFRELGWSPHISLKNGLEKIIQSFDEENKKNLLRL